MTLANDILAEKCRRSQAAYMRHFMPTWIQRPFHETIQNDLRDCIDKGNQRILVSIPPQHGKSEILAKEGVPYILGHDPSKRILFGSYSDELAAKWSRHSRNRIKDNKYRDIFPDTEIQQGDDNIKSWTTTAGGSATYGGVRGGATGLPADIIIIDDPIKNRAEAESITIRDTVWDMFKTTYLTRLQPGASVIVIQTRWHQEDLIGKIVSSGENWEYTNIPAHDEDGNWLFPERFSEESYLERKRMLGTYDWESLYMGNPRKPEGALWKRSFLIAKGERDIPAKLHDPRNWCAYFDLAFSEKQTADYTCSAAFAWEQNRLWIKSPERVQIEMSDLKKYIANRVTALGVQRYGVDSTFGQAVFARELTYMDELADKAFVKITADGKDKLTNFLPLLARYEQNEVYHVGDGWSQWYDELADFTGTKADIHDDCVDCLVGGYKMVVRKQKTGAINFNPLLT